MLGSESCRKETLIFLRNGGQFFILLVWALLRPQTAIRQHPIFLCVIFSLFSPLKSKYLETNYMVIPLLGCLTRLDFKTSKKLIFGWKMGILKMLSKISVSSTHTATLEIWWYLIHKMTSFKKWKKCILGVKLGSGSKLNLNCF